MRGYVEQIEKEHFHHGDNCGCEVDLASRPTTRPAFKSWLASMETNLPHGGECDCNGCAEWYFEHKDD